MYMHMEIVNNSRMCGTTLKLSLSYNYLAGSLINAATFKYADSSEGFGAFLRLFVCFLCVFFCFVFLLFLLCFVFVYMFDSCFKSTYKG